MSVDRFAYFSPDVKLLPMIQKIRSAYADMLVEILTWCPPGRERDVAIESLETSAMWAIKSIVLPRE